MATDSPSPRGRTNSGCFLILSTLGFAVVVVGLMVWAFGWMDDRTPWAGRGVLIILVVGLSIPVVSRLLARPRSGAKLVAAGIVVALAGLVLYLGVARPAVRDRERDELFAGRIAELRAAGDGLEAVARELPDPASASPADIRAALGRARERLAQVPDPDPDAIGLDEYDRYTPAQKAALAKELSRATMAMQAFHERHAALRAALDKKKDKP